MSCTKRQGRENWLPLLVISSVICSRISNRGGPGRKALGRSKVYVDGYPVQEMSLGNSAVGSHPYLEVEVAELSGRPGASPGIGVAAQYGGVLRGSLSGVPFGRGPGGTAVPRQLHVHAVIASGVQQPPVEVHLDSPDFTGVNDGKAVVIETVIVTVHQQGSAGSRAAVIGKGAGRRTFEAVAVAASIRGLGAGAEKPGDATAFGRAARSTWSRRPPGERR